MPPPTFVPPVPLSITTSSTSTSRRVVLHSLRHVTKSVISPPSSSSSTSPSPSPSTSSTSKARSDGNLNPDSSKLPAGARETNWMFYDVARILAIAGDGGDGIVSFLREKGKPRGGPSGGNGGNGGSIYLRATKSAGNTLSKFKFRHRYAGAAGSRGLSKGKHGANAVDITVPVPLGTLVRDAERGDDILADMRHEGDIYLLMRGGRGGRGNQSFKSDANRAPRICENGEKGVARWITLELKLVADCALIGLPNTGKSSLLTRVSNATPKIANYPFTTVVPNLGVVTPDAGGGDRGDSDALVIADIPGLIEGAHEGVGMGISFLRHIERCKILIHLIDGAEIITKFPNNVKKQKEELTFQYTLIQNELLFYNPRLGEKKQVILVNKADIPGVRCAFDDHWRDVLVTLSGHRRVACVSAHSGEGVAGVMRRLTGLVTMYEREEVESEQDVQDNLIDYDLFKARNEHEEDLYYGEKQVRVWKVEGMENTFEIGGYKVKRVYDMTNWDYIESIDRFQRVLSALGVNKQLIQIGIHDGDTIHCFDRQFDFYKEENIYSAAAALDGYLD